MSRMWWFGLLFVTALLLSFTGFIDADADEDSKAEEDTNAELPSEDNTKKKIKLLTPKIAKSVSIHENLEVKEQIAMPVPVHENLEVKEQIAMPVPVHENLEIKEPYLADMPEPIFTFPEKEKEAEKPPGDDQYELSKAEAVEHMKQVAEESEQRMKETVLIADRQKDDTEEQPIEKEGDLIEGVLIENYPEQTAEDILEMEAEDEKYRREALSNVEMLRRSDRSAAGEENPPNGKTRVFIKAIPPEHELYKIYELHEEEEEELHKQEVVFLNTDSHAHVVLKSKDHSKVSFQHDDFRHDEM